ncbi:MAG: hypothetical protein IJ228_01795 [Succinivibrio sp.]|nr:hypothetical protein [Succinivibrio sp.]
MLKKSLENLLGTTSDSGDSDRKQDEETYEEYERVYIKKGIKQFFWIRFVMFWFAVLVVITLAVIYTLHITLPQDIRWLSAQDLDKMERASISIFIGVLSALISSMVLEHKRK